MNKYEHREKIIGLLNNSSVRIEKFEFNSTFYKIYIPGTKATQYRTYCSAEEMVEVYSIADTEIRTKIMASILGQNESRHNE